ncbi:binding-protein-dependent transport systems inner membrane component [Xylanimonas cellulosilytica DSM 15894]|uniref:Binding-protein-dependent transport systems inner membrane component n=1 Tax=Xylanimonas cellulosilytica (strain DSM 15894 / JCM 12276 / CECT 5975 / KCTC 9989 / LMG 20990 / NBRC 107835 / XIL07) TaxID=446471 RepID=D1BYR0_XYLCX|nr:ABC transporter permease [Xylanimonas cellulosilytica]ACZ29985.1 binding-protein-dependent transport systems inner membrane component [Xylanimonas cellulosilytica DSM 15894]
MSEHEKELAAKGADTRRELAETAAAGTGFSSPAQLIDSQVDAGGVVTPSLPKQRTLWSDAWHMLRRSWMFWVGAVLAVVFTVMAVAPQLFTNADPRECNLSNSNLRPSAEHWFGFDQQGCDFYANVVYGARSSLTIGLLSVLVILALGILLGAVAGYYGGLLDTLVSRVADIFYALPLILGAVVLLRVGPQTGFPLLAERGVWAIIIALGTFGWMTSMRLVRSQVIALKNSDFVAAARALGASSTRVLVRHILPNAVAPVLVYATITIGVLIAAEATLTFLGVGLTRPAISWGLQISTGQSLLRTAPHIVLFPSFFLSLTVIAFTMLGDALRDALDPKARR